MNSRRRYHPAVAILLNSGLSPVIAWSLAEQVGYGRDVADDDLEGGVKAVFAAVTEMGMEFRSNPYPAGSECARIFDQCVYKARSERARLIGDERTRAISQGEVGR